jgi:hypothetical protein
MLSNLVGTCSPASLSRWTRFLLVRYQSALEQRNPTTRDFEARTLGLVRAPGYFLFQKPSLLSMTLIDMGQEEMKYVASRRRVYYMKAWLVRRNHQH